MEARVLEGWIDFAAELSVICARRPQGEMITFPVTENQHEDQHHGESRSRRGDFRRKCIGKRNRSRLNCWCTLAVEGLLAVEMFLTKSGQLLVNELAPRPHNSGHYTIDACITSQFEQHARAVCDAPLGDTRQHSPAVMVNLLGDLWPQPERAPDWSPVLLDACAKLHLYGKRVAKPGRKMGHFTILGDSIPELLLTAGRIRHLSIARVRSAGWIGGIDPPDVAVRCE